MNLGAALTGALLTTLTSPSTWPFALATFLLRGGLVLVLLPVVVLPSPVGLGNVLAPILMTVVFQGVSVQIAAFVAAGVLAIVAWLVVGGFLAAILEAEAARTIALDGDITGMAEAESTPPPIDRELGTRILGARLVAHGLTGMALLWGVIRLTDVAYAELTRPLEVATPIALRVLTGAPDAVVPLFASWAFGEVIGALAARRIALGGTTAVGGLRDAIGALIRHPLTVVTAFLIPTAGLAIVLATSSIGAAVTWSAVRIAMRSPAELILGTLAVLAFVSLWLAGLLLVAVTAAWRAAVWSVAYHDLWLDRRSPRGVKTA